MGNVPHPQRERGGELPVAGAQERVRQPHRPQAPRHGRLSGPPDDRAGRAGLRWHPVLEPQPSQRRARDHGLSAYGPSSITATTAGYVPASLDPVTPGAPRRAFTNSLANPSFKSLLVQWTVYL